MSSKQALATRNLHQFQETTRTWTCCNYHSPNSLFPVFDNLMKWRQRNSWLNIRNLVAKIINYSVENRFTWLRRWLRLHKSSSLINFCWQFSFFFVLHLEVSIHVYLIQSYPMRSNKQWHSLPHERIIREW